MNSSKTLGLKVTKIDPDKYTHIFFLFYLAALGSCDLKEGQGQEAK